MTKPDCPTEIVERLYSIIYDGPITRVRRTVCHNERTYTKIDSMWLRKGERLQPPPCTCKPMVEPFEMI